MASREYEQLRRLGFSERFLRTTAGNHPTARAAFLRHQEKWQPCRNCGGTFVFVNRLPDPVLNQHGRDMRGASIRPHNNGLCSALCAAEALQCTEEEAYSTFWKMEFACRKDFYITRQWRELRYKAFARNGNRCQCCGASSQDGIKLHVDHIKPKYRWPEKCLDLDNLQILCEDCNLGKGMHSAEDWREVS